MNGPRIVLVLVAASIVWVVGVLAVYGTGEAGVRLAVRTTARLSFVVFSATYLASALARRFPGSATRWLRRNRRYWGVSFGLVHGIHGVTIGLLELLLGDAFQVDALAAIFGGGAYVMILLLLVTSTDAAVKRLGPERWGLLHRVGVHYVWFIFAFMWLGEALRSPFYTAVTLFALALPVFRYWAFRTSAHASQGRPRPRHGPPPAGAAPLKAPR